MEKSSVTANFFRHQVRETRAPAQQHQYQRPLRSAHDLAIPSDPEACPNKLQTRVQSSRSKFTSQTASNMDLGCCVEGHRLSAFTSQHASQLQHADHIITATYRRDRSHGLDTCETAELPGQEVVCEQSIILGSGPKGSREALVTLRKPMFHKSSWFDAELTVLSQVGRLGD